MAADPSPTVEVDRAELAETLELVKMLADEAKAGERRSRLLKRLAARCRERIENHLQTEEVTREDGEKPNRQLEAG